MRLCRASEIHIDGTGRCGSFAWLSHWHFHEHSPELNGRTSLEPNSVPARPGVSQSKCARSDCLICGRSDACFDRRGRLRRNHSLMLESPPVGVQAHIHDCPRRTALHPSRSCGPGGGDGAAHLRPVLHAGAAVHRLRQLSKAGTAGIQSRLSRPHRRYRRGFARQGRPVAMAADDDGRTHSQARRSGRGGGRIRYSVFRTGPDLARGGGAAAGAGRRRGDCRGDCRSRNPRCHLRQGNWRVADRACGGADQPDFGRSADPAEGRLCRRRR